MVRSDWTMLLIFSPHQIFVHPTTLYLKELIIKKSLWQSWHVISIVYSKVTCCCKGRREAK